MKEIGEFLKQKRLEKGITIEQIVNKTRMPAARIKAIEEGDLAAFKDDITYLHFFIQSYCGAIGIDYQEVKQKLNDSINSYTVSFHADQIRQQNESEKSIREKSTQRVNEYKKKNPSKKVERKVDFSLISFVAVIALILICVLSVGGYYLTQHLNLNPNEPPVEEPQPETPDDKPQVEKPEEPEKKEIEVKAGDDVSRFVIENAEEKFTVKVEFIPNSWFQAKMDGTVMNTPAVKVYDAGDTLEIEVDPAKNKELNMRFGYFAGIKLYVDGKEVEIDASIANKPGVQEITFTIGGGIDESAE